VAEERLAPKTCAGTETQAQARNATGAGAKVSYGAGCERQMMAGDWELFIC